MPPTNSSPDPRASVERVVLLGYMCSGKSTVGESLSRRLEWDYLDFDVEIERREKHTVSEIIEARGEDYFRSLEEALTREAAEAAGLVLAPGGGWITHPEWLRMLGPGTIAVWLQVSAEETVRRLRADSIDRPFKQLEDPLPRVAEMLAEREPLYRLADMAIPADGRGVEPIAFEVEQLVRTRGMTGRRRNDPQ